MKLALEGKLAHGGHPVLAWMVDNIHVRTDPAGNIKPDKQKSTEKIDGVVATIMALDRAIRCGQCDSWYGSKNWHAGTKYEKRIWRCNHKYDGEQKCATPSLGKEIIKTAFTAALQQMLDGQTGVDEVLDQAVRAEFDTSALEAAGEKLLAEVESAAAAIDKVIDRNAKSALNQDEYARRFNALTTRHAKLADQYERLTSQIIDKQNRFKAYEYYKTEVAKLEWARLEFTPYLFHTLIDHATAKTNGTIEFTFRDGTKAAI